MKTESQFHRLTGTIAYQRGANAGLTDAKRYDDDPPNFEATPNPYGCDTEAAQHEAWEIGYENTFEGSKTKP